MRLEMADEFDFDPQYHHDQGHNSTKRILSLPHKVSSKLDIDFFHVSDVQLALI
jgi:hypothetical protein